MTTMVAGAVYESVRPCRPDRKPTRLMVTTPGAQETHVVSAYTGRSPRVIPSARLHEKAYLRGARRLVRSGYVRMNEPASHFADVVRGALVSARLSPDLVVGATFGADPLRGGTISLSCPTGHPAVPTVTGALAALGYSADPGDGDGRTILRVRFGPGGTYCPVRWLTHEDWTMHYCGQKARQHEEHYDQHTGSVWWDGDDDGLDWPHRAPPVQSILRSR